MIFPTKEELRSMSLARLRLIDVKNIDEETIVQEIVNEKTKILPPTQEISRKGIPDIKTPEEEAKFQKVIDERIAKIRGETNIPEDSNPVVALEKPFCNFCDSKGVRHKKDCTRPE